MRFELLSEDRGEIRIVTLVGVFESRAAGGLQKSLAGILTKNWRGVLLDLERLESITGESLRVMIAAAVRLKASGGALALCSPKAQVKRVLETADLDRTLPHFVNREAACDWLEGTIQRERVARLATRLLRRNQRKQLLFRMERADSIRTALAAKLLFREDSSNTLHPLKPRS